VEAGPLESIDQVDWSRLMHAYGRATDTPAHLRALISDDAQAREQALDHLWSAIIHQGSPWTATGSAAVVVAELVAARAGPTRELLDFLAEVATAAVADDVAELMTDEELEDDAHPDDPELRSMVERAVDMFDEDPEVGPYGSDVDLAGPLYARAVLGCRKAAAPIHAAAAGCRSDPDPTVRAEAARVEAILARLPTPPGDRADVLDLLTARASDAGLALEERCGCILSLVELGGDTAGLLDDPSLAVRAFAALSPRAPVRRALDVLREALSDPAAVDSWFSRPPGHLRRRPRFALVAAAIERADSFADLVDIAVAVAAFTSYHCVDDDWGPLLRAAFPEGRAPGQPLTADQRRYLQALVDNPDLWAPIGNAVFWFRPLGLEQDRRQVEALLRTGSKRWPRRRG
jgi:hypothetical protein